MAAIPLGSSALIGEIILIAVIAVVLFFIFMIGKAVLKLVFGVIINSVLGLIAIFLLNDFLDMQIPIHAYTLIPTILFGLPAVGTFVIMRLFGVLPLHMIII